MVHWLFGMCLLLLGLITLAEVIVGPEVWRRRAWRIYLWPGIAFGLGVAMWPVMTFFTNSAIHMVAHGAWAQALMVMGGAELGLAKGKLTSRWWKLATPVGLAVSGAAFLVHEQNGWFFARSAFLHHLMGGRWSRPLFARARVPTALDLPSVRVRLSCWRWQMLLCDRTSPPSSVTSLLAGRRNDKTTRMVRRGKVFRAGGSLHT
jgi:hypothetical protein